MNQSPRVQTRGRFFLALLVCVASAATQAQSTSPSDARVDSILNKMSLEEKIDYIGGTGFAIRAMPDLHLPAFEMSDGPLGVRSNSRFPSTVYAAGIGLAATWNRDLAERVGEGIGRDARARGIHFMLGPGVKHLSLAAERQKLRILRRRSFPRVRNGRWLHKRHATAGCERDDQALPRQ